MIYEWRRAFLSRNADSTALIFLAAFRKTIPQSTAIPLINAQHYPCIWHAAVSLKMHKVIQYIQLNLKTLQNASGSFVCAFLTISNNFSISTKINENARSESTGFAWDKLETNKRSKSWNKLQLLGNKTTEINSNQLKSTQINLLIPNLARILWEWSTPDPHKIHRTLDRSRESRESRDGEASNQVTASPDRPLGSGSTEYRLQFLRWPPRLQGSPRSEKSKTTWKHLKTIQDHPMFGNASNSPLTASLNPDASSRFHSLASCPHAAKVLDCPKELNCIQLCQTNNCQVPPNKRSSPGSPSSPSACVELRTLAMPKSPIFKLPRSVPCRFQPWDKLLNVIYSIMRMRSLLGRWLFGLGLRRWKDKKK